MTYTSNDFPTSIQNPSSPTANTEVATFDHAGLETFQNESIKALKDKVGANGSAVTTSHDYKLSEITSTDKAVGKSATQTLTNKTLTAPKIATGGFIADENGNEQIEFSTTANAVNEIRVANASTGNSPTIDVQGDDTNIDLSLKGKGTGNVKFGTANIKLPNADGTSGQVLQTDGSGNLSFASPSQSVPFYISTTHHNYFQTTGGFYSDVYSIYSNSSTEFKFEYTTSYMQRRDTTSDWASSNAVNSAVVLGSYIYVFIRDSSNNYRLYRYSVTDLASGGTLMTISGQAFATTGGNDVRMTSNGTDFFFNYKGGNSANDYRVSRYTISGTTLTYVSDIVCGSTADSVRAFAVDSSNNVYGFSTSDSFIRKFNSSGTLQYTTGSYRSMQCVANILGNFFAGYRIDPGGGASSSQYERIYLS
jgi:hypothetical protein